MKIRSPFGSDENKVHDTLAELNALGQVSQKPKANEKPTKYPFKIDPETGNVELTADKFVDVAAKVFDSLQAGQIKDVKITSMLGDFRASLALPENETAVPLIAQNIRRYGLAAQMSGVSYGVWKTNKGSLYISPASELSATLQVVADGKGRGRKHILAGSEFIPENAKEGGIYDHNGLEQNIVRKPSMSITMPFLMKAVEGIEDPAIAKIVYKGKSHEDLSVEHAKPECKVWRGDAPITVCHVARDWERAVRSKVPCMIVKADPDSYTGFKAVAIVTPLGTEHSAQQDFTKEALGALNDIRFFQYKVPNIHPTDFEINYPGKYLQRGKGQRLSFAGAMSGIKVDGALWRADEPIEVPTEAHDVTRAEFKALQFDPFQNPFRVIESENDPEVLAIYTPPRFEI